MSGSLEKRFYRKVSKYRTEKGCIEWTAATNGRYGIIRSSKPPFPWILAHRVAYELHYGPVQNEVVVMHECDNPLCVNWEHLSVGSHKDNTQDMLRKNRQRKSAFSDADLREMRQMRTAGLTQQEIASDYGVSRPLISMLLAGKIALRTQ